MRWITATQLESWARGLASRTDLPGLVADLIRATAPDIAAMRFPSGDKGEVRGFDGHLVSVQAALNVPEGRSIWEFGTAKDYQGKALADFRCRTADVAPVEQAQVTLALVTPWTWDDPSRVNKIEDWIDVRKSESAWKDIRVIDGAMLETWFDHCPAVAAWHARRTLGVAPPEGVSSTDAFWSRFSGRFAPPLTEDVLLCGREDLAKTVLAFLLGRPDMLSLVADAPDEATAFAVAVIRKAPPAERLFLEARTLVLDRIDASEHLIGYPTGRWKLSPPQISTTVLLPRCSRRRLRRTSKAPSLLA